MRTDECQHEAIFGSHQSNKLPVDLCLVFRRWHPVYGGPNYYCYRVLEALSGHFEHVTIFVPHQTIIPLTRPAFSNVELVELSNPLYLKRSALGRDLFGLHVLIHIQRRTRHDRLPPVVYFGSGDLSVGWRAAAILGRRMNVPVIVECVLIGADDGESLVSAGRLRAFTRFAMQSVERFSCISTGLADSMARVGVPKERIAYNPYGINLLEFGPSKAEEKLAIRREFGLPEEGFLGVCVGGIHARKGVLDLVRSWVALQASKPDMPIRLLIVGESSDPAYMKEVRSFLYSHPYGRSVIFLGLRQDIALILKACDIYCSASHAEGLGIATLEALASGLPVVQRYISGVSEDLQYKRSVSVLHQWTDDGFVNIVNLLMNEKEWEGASVAARENAEIRFSLEGRIERIKRLCRYSTWHS